jgi:hypothetical protein
MYRFEECDADDPRTIPLDLQAQLTAVEAQRVILRGELEALDQERSRLLRRESAVAAPLGRSA